MINSEATIGKAVVDVYRTAKKEGWLDKFLAVFRKKHRILVLGSSGAGKTQLIRSLSSVVPDVVGILERTQFVERNNIEISKNLFEFVEAPGELSMFDARLEAIAEAARRKYDLVLNVVSYGYHEYSEENASLIFDDNGAVQAEFLKEHRDIEIDLLAEWCETLSESKRPPRVITIVTKADIWWDNKDSVIKNYRNGDYAEIISHHKYQHSVVPYSSRIYRMHKLGATSRYFDELTKAELRAQLFRTLFSGINVSNPSEHVDG
ncbi:GTPase domain-containing protein [uncultured Tateyamaria sp.]|uniref:GTPase domain-containing protein n=1 Tax=Tateyamaria sp. 1078 TaxID=3417464 RepID=UPI0026156829|nr:GTPase domain-containing protein [uncultured Tateyamaria sp.]